MPFTRKGTGTVIGKGKKGANGLSSRLFYSADPIEVVGLSGYSIGRLFALPIAADAAFQRCGENCQNGRFGAGADLDHGGASSQYVEFPFGAGTGGRIDRSGGFVPAGIAANGGPAEQRSAEDLLGNPNSR